MRDLYQSEPAQARATPIHTRLAGKRLSRKRWVRAEVAVGANPDRRILFWALSGLFWLAGIMGVVPRLYAESKRDTYSKNEVVRAASDFFGTTSEATAMVVEHVFQDLGEPVGYIAGSEVSGAFGVGLRYGEGELVMKSGARRKVYWQGPTVGFDAGGNASKAFTLVYGLKRVDDIFKRFPGVDGSIYFVAGIGVNYQTRGAITLAPMRTGVGFRAGVNAGYLKYSREKRILPL